MARHTKPTSDEFDYQVEQLPLYRGGSAVKVGGSPIMGNFRKDNGVCLGTSTETYEIVNNGEVVKVFEEPGKNNSSDDDDPFTVSDVDTMIKHLKENAGQ